MATISEALALALQHHQAGRLEAAEQIYRRILQVEPDQPDALHFLGVLTAQLGKHQAAVDYIARAITVNPNVAPYHLNLGLAYQESQKLDEAIASYRRALQLQPGFVEVHFNLGNALTQQGQLAEAVACYRRALELKPDYAEAHCNLGNALLGQGKLDEAAACCRRALQLKPDFTEAHYNLGNVLKDLGELDEAIACFRHALELKPDFAEAYSSLGFAFWHQGKLDEAVACCCRVLKLKPDCAAAHNNLGNALKDQGKLDEAAACYRRTLELKPDFVEAHSNLGNVLKEIGKLDEAVACCRRALELKPDYAEAHSNLGIALASQGKLDEAIACFRRALELQPSYAKAHSNLLLTLQYCAGVTPKALARAHAEYDRQHAAPLRGAVTRHEKVHDRCSRLRLGFVSSDLGRHPVGYFLVRVLENLCQEPAETICYSERIAKDDVTRRLQAAATHWRDVHGMSDQRLAEQIRADRIDILFDLAGHTAHNRLLVFARKPAPIQVTWAGYVGTTGLSAMDYLLADRYEIPPQAEADYCEKVLRMPDGYVCYDPPSYAPHVSPLPALKQGYVTFGCFNNLAKINRQVIEVWAKILHRLPNSRLVLKYKGMNVPSIAKDLTALFAGRGVDSKRLAFLGFSPHVESLAEYNRVDLVLDPFPYSGGLTTCEALWMGAPVITCPGETFASRHSLSHLSNVGLTETIAHDLDEYVELAVSLAVDLPRLAMLRMGLRERMAASPLCDGKRFATNLMASLQGVWAQ